MKSRDSRPSVSPSLEKKLLSILDMDSEVRQEAVTRLLQLHPAQADAIHAWFAVVNTETAAPVTSETAELPERIGPYRIDALLGRGGMGNVYLAQHERLPRKVALKVMRSDYLAHPNARRRFEREVRSASRLDHPHICHVYEVGEEKGRPYMAMQWIQGEPLAGRLQRAREAVGEPDSSTGVSTSKPSNRTEMFEVVAMVETVARALDVAHEAGLVHRDVKPGNIMIATDGHPVVLDFGLARDESDIDQQLSSSQDILGTPMYMAPEQIRPNGRSADRRTDVYGLGITLYECLTLTTPFAGKTRADLFAGTLSGVHLSAAQLNRRVPGDLDIVLERAIDRDPAQRYQTALEFAEDLRRMRSFEPIRARRTGPVLRTRRWVQRNPAPATALLMLVVGLVVTIDLLVQVRAAEASARAQGATSAYQAATSELQRGDWESALTHCDEALAAGYPDRVEVKLLRVQALEGASRPAAAIAALDELTAAGPLGQHAAHVRLLRGYNALVADLDQGLSLIAEAIALHEGGGATLSPADVESGRGLLAERIPGLHRHLQAALQHDPRHFMSMQLLGPTLLALGRGEDLLDHVARFELLFPGHREVRVLAIVTLALMGRFEEARTELEANSDILSEHLLAIARPAIDLIAMLDEETDLAARQMAAEPARLPVKGISKIARTLAITKVAVTATGIANHVSRYGRSARGTVQFRLPPQLQRGYRPLIRGWMGLITDPLAGLAKVGEAIAEIVDETAVSLLRARALQLKPMQTEAAWREFLAILDEAETYPGISGCLPSMRRLHAAMTIGGLMSLRHHTAKNETDPGDEVGSRLVRTLVGAAAMPGISEVEFHSYVLLAWNTNVPNRGEVVERLLWAWKDRHGDSTEWLLLRGDIKMAQGAPALAKRLAETALERSPGDARAQKLLDQANEQLAK